MAKNLGRKIAGIAAGTAMLGGAMLAAATPAQAYSPDPSPTIHTKKTYNCPGASGCQISDVIDGTYFKKDSGGQAVKIDLWQKGSYVGKVEYHPYGEHLYVYDNKRDGDAIYVTLSYMNEENGHWIHTGPYKGGSTTSSIHRDLSHHEGQPIYIKVWDGYGGGDGADLIAKATAVA